MLFPISWLKFKASTRWKVKGFLKNIYYLRKVWYNFLIWKQRLQTGAFSRSFVSLMGEEDEERYHFYDLHDRLDGH